MTARVIVERGEGSDVLLMFPDGDVRAAKSVKTAERMVLAWAKRNLPASGILITSIVWRDGLEPTTAQ
jgi:hypothetical protein